MSGEDLKSLMIFYRGVVALAEDRIDTHKMILQLALAFAR